MYPLAGINDHLVVFRQAFQHLRFGSGTVADSRPNPESGGRDIVRYDPRSCGILELDSKNVFRPERGLWYLSGYVLSKKGAQALLKLLPSRGPIDLWINHKFREMDVRALRRSVINQRLDTPSTNSHSVIQR